MGSCGSCGPGVQSKISTWQGALARAGTPGHRWLLVRGAPTPAATGQGAPGRGHSALAGGRLCSSVHWPSPAGPSGSLSHTPRPGCCSSGLGGLGSGPECGRVCAPALRRHGRMRVLQGRCGRGPAPCQPSRVPPARSLPGRLATARAGCWDRPPFPSFMVPLERRPLLVPTCSGHCGRIFCHLSWKFPSLRS